MQAYAGTTIAGLPNFFMLLGPNTGLGHNSVVFMIESQINYVMGALREMDRRGWRRLEVREEAVREYNQGLQERMRGTVWTEGGCASWYLDAAGRNTTLWPGFTFTYRERVRRFDPAAYVADSPAGAPGRAAEAPVTA
jgi:hypothetical protein